MKNCESKKKRLLRGKVLRAEKWSAFRQSAFGWGNGLAQTESARIRKKRELRGRAMRSHGWSAFAMVFVPFVNDPNLRPSEHNCDGCASWGSVNGCEGNHRTILTCTEFDDDEVSGCEDYDPYDEFTDRMDDEEGLW